MAEEMHQMESNDLIKELKIGNVDAFDEVYIKFSPRINGFAYRYLRSQEEAEEIVQEVFISLWKYKSGIDESKNFDSYLFTITFNAIRKRIKELLKEKQSVEHYQKMNKLFFDDAGLESEYNALHENVMKAVEMLPSRQKEIFILSREKGLTNMEIAAMLDIKKKTVENNLNRAIHFLKEMLVKHGVIGVFYIVWLC